MDKDTAKVKKDDKQEVAQAQPEAPKPAVQEARHLILVTDGNRAEQRSCTMLLFEKKQVLEAVLANTIQEINAVAAATGPQPVAPEKPDDSEDKKEPPAKE